MGNLISSMIGIAERQALRSQCRYKVGAVLVSGSRVLAASPNLYRNSPLIDFRHATFHAEEAVLRRVAKASGAVAYVARIDSYGAARIARPCERCQVALAAAGVRRVFFTDNKGVDSLVLA